MVASAPDVKHRLYPPHLDPDPIGTKVLYKKAVLLVGPARKGALAQRCDDVREHVLDLVAHREQDDYDHDRYQDKDERVLDHSLTALGPRRRAGGI